MQARDSLDELFAQLESVSIEVQNATPGMGVDGIKCDSCVWNVDPVLPFVKESLARYGVYLCPKCYVDRLREDADAAGRSIRMAQQWQG